MLKANSDLRKRKKFNLVISVVSHQQGDLVGKLLSDLSTMIAKDVMVVITINIPELENFINEGKLLSIHVIRNSVPIGFGANHNQASKLFECNYFAVINPDIHFNPEIFKNLEKVILEDQSVAVCGPCVTNEMGIIEDSARFYPSLSIIMRRQILRALGKDIPLDYHLAGSGTQRVEWIAGMFMFFRFEAFNSIGGFDEQYFMYLEDADICRRLKRAGWGIEILRDVRVVHNARRSSHSSLKYLRWHVSSLLRFLIGGFCYRSNKAL